MSDLVATSIAALAAVLVLALVVGMFSRRLQRPPAKPPAVVRADAPVEHSAVVILDVDGADPAAPAVQRLVHEAAARVFAAAPDTREVEVRARDGGVLGQSARFAPRPRVVWLPAFLREPHLPRHHGMDVSGHLAEDEPFVLPPREGPVEVAPAPATARRLPIIERFDLPLSIRARVRNEDDPVDVIRAILEAGNLAVDREDDLLSIDGLAIVVVCPDEGGGHEALNHAYRRIAASAAERGLVVALDHIDPTDVRRREILAPEVLHTGFAGVQRMADAVALGADPIRFAVAPALAPAHAEAA